MILTALISFASFKFNQTEQVNSPQVGKNINFGGFGTTLIVSFVLVTQAPLMGKINNITPEHLNEYPNKLLIYYVHFFVPFLIGFLLVILFYGKSPELRLALKRLFCPDNSAHIVMK